VNISAIGLILLLKTGKSQFEENPNGARTIVITHDILKLHAILLTNYDESF